MGKADNRHMPTETDSCALETSGKDSSVPCVTPNSCSQGNNAEQLNYQIVGFKWKKNGEGWQPFFLVSNGADSQAAAKFELWGKPINIKLGKKRCTGYFFGGLHFKCPDSAEVGYASTCTACKQKDDWFGCIQCTGEFAAQAPDLTAGEGGTDSSAQTETTAPHYNILCNNLKRREGCQQNTYWIYLAAFDGQLKVGVSYEHRFFERLIEQGADFGCRLGVIKDGGYARAIEQKVARYLGLPDKIHGAMKQTRIFGDPNSSILNIADAVAKLADTNLLELRPEIFDFRRYYRLDGISLRPRSVQLMTGMRLVGNVTATKGNIVVMQTAAGMISFDARRLVGYNVELHSTCTRQN